MTAMPVTQPLQGTSTTPATPTLAGVMAELGLKPGQPVTAQVTASLPDGAVQVSLLGRLLKIPLPQALPPGTTLTLSLRNGPEGLQLAVTLPQAAPSGGQAPLPGSIPVPAPPLPGQPPPRTEAQPRAPLPQPALPAPAALPQMPVRTGTQSFPQGQQKAQPAPMPGGANPPPLQAGAAPAAPSRTLPAPAQTVPAQAVPQALRAALPLPIAALPPVASPPAGPSPSPSSAPAAPVAAGAAPAPVAPALVGQVVGRLPDGTTRIDIGRTSVDLPLKIALPPGSAVVLSAAPAQPGLPPPVTVVPLPPASGASPVPGTVIVPSAPAGPPAPVAPAAVLPNAAPVPQPGAQPVGGTPVGTAGPLPGPAPAAPQAAPSAPLPMPAAAPMAAMRPAVLAMAAPSAPAPTAVPPVVREAAQQALGQQASLAPLLTGLAQMSGRMATWPAPVAQAAMQLLAARLNTDRPISAAALQQAIGKSGLFLEADLAQPAAGNPARGDIKANLMQLRQGLAHMLGAQGAPVEAVNRAPPPLRGLPPRAAPAEPAPPLPDQPEAAGKQLLGHTEGALSRLRLHQAASLPDPAQARNPDSAAEWRMEIPLQIGPQTAMLALQVNRDGRPKGGRKDRGWQMRFAVDLTEAGEVGAQIGLRDSIASIMIWAEEPETAEAINQMLPELADGLAARGVAVGHLVCRVGAPRDGGAGAGRLVDARS